MNHPKFILSFCTAAAFALFGCGFSAASAAATRPNIVILFADDMGYGEVRALNPERGKIPTPNLDKLTASGMVFTDAHSASSVCTPSRYALLTGRYGWRTRLQQGVSTGGGEPLIAQDRLTLASMLKQKGYSTAISGKWHLDFHWDGPRDQVGTRIPDGPLTRGFDTWLGFHHARAMKSLCKDDRVIGIIEPIEMLPRTTEFAVDFIRAKAEEAKNGKPFFLYMAFGSPHTPIVPTAEWIGKSGFGKYGDFVMMTDGMAGKIIDAIDTHGLADNTIVIFSADNGTSKEADIASLEKQGHFPSARFRGSKADLWDGGHRVPFIVRWPGGGIKPGSRSAHLIGLTDLMATIAGIVGYELPDKAAEDSISFLPALRGQAHSGSRGAIVHHSISGKFSIRTPKWKLLLAPGSGGWSSPNDSQARGQGLPDIQLYDMEQDDSERTNVHAANPGMVAELTRLLEEQVANGRSRPGATAKNDIGHIDLWKKPAKKSHASNEWRIDTTDEWSAAAAVTDHLTIKDGMVTPEAETAIFRSVVNSFKEKRSFGKITLTQSPVWKNWEPIGKVSPTNIEDAPVFLVKGPGDYWLFGLYRNGKGEVRKTGIQEHAEGFQAVPAKLKGFDVPLVTTPFPHQYDAPGGLKLGLGGYHAWQSKDMVNWIHHGPVTESVSRWVTTAEQVGGKTFIYYDYPNDQDPHLFIDEDLTDGLPGKNMGLAFRNPTDGSDCTFIRALDGKFHVIYEDWSPINAKKHSWDSPLAGHAVSPDGIKDFRILAPAVDERTKPTGRRGTYEHPYWLDHPDWKSNVAEFEIHEPEQNAFGDWAAISIGGQYYLFCDYHPAGEKIRIGWFTSDDIGKPFRFCGELGNGHPDPDIGFAEGRFYLINQTSSDYVSPGPWVESVEVRAGVDTTGDGKIDTWTDWQAAKESYDYIEGFSKQINRVPAEVDLSGLPAATGFAFELRLKDTTANPSKPIIDSVRVSFK